MEKHTPLSPVEGQDLSTEQSVLERFIEDEEGAVFLEFLIVLYAWMCILFGVIQCGLIAIGSFYVNYANFMALRTASVLYEFNEVGWISNSSFNRTCREVGLKALAPLERRYWTAPISAGGVQEGLDALMFRTRFVSRVNNSLGTTSDNKPLYIQGRFEYDYYLIVPFVNRVIAAFDPSGTDRDVPTGPGSNRVMHEFASDNTPQGRFPTFKLRSNNSVPSPINRNPGSPPIMHNMIIQRRWKY